MVRQARRSDEAVIGRMWYELLRTQGELNPRFAPSDDARERWRNDYRAWLDRLSRRMYVAEVDGEVCGFITAEQWSPPPVFDDKPGVYINELYVEPSRRRSGIGTQLVNAVKEWAIEVGAHQLRAGIVASNEAAASFWREIGGQPVARTFALGLETDTKEEREARSIGFKV